MKLTPDILRQAQPLLDRLARFATAEKLVAQGGPFKIVKPVPIKATEAFVPVEVEETSPYYEQVERIFAAELARDRADAIAALEAMGVDVPDDSDVISRNPVFQKMELAEAMEKRADAAEALQAEEAERLIAEAAAKGEDAK